MIRMHPTAYCASDVAGSYPVYCCYCCHRDTHMLFSDVQGVNNILLLLLLLLSLLLLLLSLLLVN